MVEVVSEMVLLELLAYVGKDVPDSSLIDAGEGDVSNVVPSTSAVPALDPHSPLTM
jgi:hypothetical protein